MSPKQQAFVREYGIDHNATRAAIAAGYSPKFASQKGHELTRLPEIARAIAENEKKKEEQAMMDGQQVLERLAVIVSAGMQEVPVIVQGEQVHDAEGRPVFRPLDARSATRALELIGRHFGMFTDKVEVSGEFDFQALEDARRRVLAAGAAADTDFT